MTPDPVCQSRLPLSPWALPPGRSLPGVQPLKSGRWIFRDDALAGQMALRDQLVQTRRNDVLSALPQADAAIDELVGVVLKELRQVPGYSPVEDKTGRITAIRRPDGVEVPLNFDAPLTLLARLVQEDFLILEPGAGAEHMLVAGVLCFPASWTLAEKMGKPLSAIHGPVKPYDRDMAGRVQRILDNMFAGAPLWRANWMRYNTPDLHHPRTEDAPRQFDDAAPWWMRVEFQTFYKLPRTGALVFGIHTFMVAQEDLSPDQVKTLTAALVAE